MTFDHSQLLIFMELMGLSVLVYVISDGYNLGVGMLMPRANEDGLLLGQLYLPVVLMLMLIGLTLRGVVFDFRVKARDAQKATWDRLFFAGSILVSMAQGWMLGRYISGFGEGWNYPVLAAEIALVLPAAYAPLGAAWLIMKTEGELKGKAIWWAQLTWWPVVIGMLLVSMATPWVSQTVRERWFELPQLIALMVIAAVPAFAPLSIGLTLASLLVRKELCWLPFVLQIGVFMLGFLGLAYGIYPYVVNDQLTMWEATSSPAALKVILIVLCISVPAIVAYTVFSYRLFWRKATELCYG